ncbi:MAG: hypothetical protein IT374_05795 [Polyangiaceae bacterium]|nr:hypothetical protein [Polyangiaceae bacterium]
MKKLSLPLFVVLTTLGAALAACGGAPAAPSAPSAPGAPSASAPAAPAAPAASHLPETSRRQRYPTARPRGRAVSSL